MATIKQLHDRIDYTRNALTEARQDNDIDRTEWLEIKEKELTNQLSKMEKDYGYLLA